MKELNELCSRSLYKDENICINDNWTHVLQENNEYIIQNANSGNESDTNSDANNEAHTKTLVHGLIESHRIYNLQYKIIELAPSKGQRPLWIFKEKYAEEINFPTLFYGDAHDDDMIHK